MRADVFLLEKGFVKSRARAEELINRGYVEVNGAVLAKKNKDIKEGDIVKLLGTLSFVGRGGDKLSGAIDELTLAVDGKTVLDIGSSTGGFTDCLLKRGAKDVYSVDVGSDQFDKDLAKDTRVHLSEKTDIRNFSTEAKFEMIVGDVSFISWKNIIDDVVRLSSNGTKILLLIKPQFEVGREHNKNGVVKDEVLQKQVCADVMELFKERGFTNLKVIDSSIVGGDRNREFFLFGTRV